MCYKGTQEAKMATNRDKLDNTKNKATKQKSHEDIQADKMDLNSLHYQFNGHAFYIRSDALKQVLLPRMAKLFLRMS